LEAIQLDHKCSQKIAMVKAELLPENAKAIAWEDFTEEEIEQVAAILARNNRFPPPPRGMPGDRLNGQAHSTGPRNPNITCCYCQKTGHMLKERHSCLRYNSPIGNANSKPYENNHVNNVAKKQEDSGANQKYVDAQVGAVANLSPYHHLNW
jgi:hypothetical protein